VQTFLTLAAWFGEHPAVGAVVYGWLFGICTTQALKRYYPLSWSVARVKRTSQACAAICAGVFAWRVWPSARPNGIEFAVLAGMSCPMIYTCLKAALPNILRSWGWKQIAWRRVFM
jgi:hypothetical protein